MKIIELLLITKCIFFLLIFFVNTTSFAQTKKKITKSYKELDYFTLKGHQQVKGLFKGNYRVKLTWLEGDTSKLPNLITVYFRRPFDGRVKREWYIYQDKNKEAIISIRPEGGEYGYGTYYHDSTYHTPNKVICLKTNKEDGIIMGQMISIVEKTDDRNYNINLSFIGIDNYGFKDIDLNTNPSLFKNTMSTDIKYFVENEKNYIIGKTHNHYYDKKKRVSVSLFWLLQIGDLFLANN